jgi:hypothetical protein
VTGTLTGDWFDTRAFLLETPTEQDTALQALRRKYGWQMCLTDVLSRLTGKMNKRAYIRVERVTA